MDQDNQSQSQTQEEDPNKEAEASPTNTAPPASDTTTSQLAPPSRPRRPQRSARVEGSVDISEPKAEPTPPIDQDTSDGTVASHAKPSRPAAVKPVGELPMVPSMKTGPKGPGHHPVRAGSVPLPLASRPVPPHLNPHAQRALSVAGTADTQAQTVEDFRQVSQSVCALTFMSQLVSTGPLIPRQIRKISHNKHTFSEGRQGCTVLVNKWLNFCFT